MCYTGQIGSFDYERQEDGTFLYKAKENAAPVKKIINAQYKERPQYPLIEQYENESVKRFQNNLKTTVKQVVQLLKHIENE